MIPSSLHYLFWDVDDRTFDPQEHPRYTIARVLEYGNSHAVSWLQREFSRQIITEVLRTERRLSRKTATFWAIAYAVPFEEVPALRLPPQGLWPFS